MQEYRGGSVAVVRAIRSCCQPRGALCWGPNRKESTEKMSPTAVVDGAEQPEPAELSEAYVHSLASLGLERLQNEPGRLNAEAIAVDEVTTLLPASKILAFW